MKLLQTFLTTVAVVLFFCPPVVAGSASGHVNEALKQAQYASIAGKNGNVNQLLSQAEESLKYATAALSQSSDSNQSLPLSEAIRNLDQAIAHAKEDRADVAAQHVDQAISLLKEASR